jgi:hypothetical protein
MGRTSHRPGRRNHLIANRDLKDGKILKVFRHVNTDNSAQIGGVIHDWEREGEFPELKNIPRRHTAYLLDPRLMYRKFNGGFIAGYNFHRAQERIAEPNRIAADPTIPAKIGSVSITGHNRKVVIAELESEALLAERRAIYEVLGEAGIKSFGIFVSKPNMKVPNPTIHLGTFKEGVSFNDQDKVIDMFETAIAIHHMADITLSRTYLQTYQPSNG